MSRRKTNKGSSARSRSPGELDVQPVVLKKLRIDEIDLTDTTYQLRLRCDWKAVKESMAVQGQINPISVVSGNGSYVILDGFCRVHAAEELSLTSIIAEIYPGLTHEQAIMVAFVKNVVRKNLSSLEKTNAIVLANQHGLSTSAISDLLGLGERQVERYLELPEEILEVVDGKSFTITHGKVIADFLKRVQASGTRSLVRRFAAT